MSVADNTLVKTGGKSRRLVFGVLGLLLLALLALMVVSLSWLKQDRADLAAQFSKDRLLAITDVAREVESDIEDITEDLFLAARLMRTVSASETHRDLLEAILSVGKAYQAFIVFGPDGGVEHFLTDPRRGGPQLEEVVSIAKESAAAALREEGEGIKVSPLLVDGKKTIRMFTLKLFEDREESAGALTLVVDMSQYIDRFKIAASDEHTHLFILGPYGDPAPRWAVTMAFCDGPSGKTPANGGTRL